MSTSTVKKFKTSLAAAQVMGAVVAGVLVFGTVATTEVAAVAQRAAPESFADLVEKLQPAVVNISTVQTIEPRRRRGSRRNAPDFPEGSPFGDFFDQFRDRFGGREEEEPRQARSLGSGFIIGKDGHVVTNHHVIEGADEITVTTVDGTEYEAELIGRDQQSDLALLKIDNGDEDFPFVSWGDSDGERVGDWLVAIGNPYGLGGTVTAGILSGRNRIIDDGSTIDFIQTDAPINRGNSGGPLFNMDGEVIGVNSAIFSPSGGNVGIGFSIPSNDAKYIIGELRDNGRVRRGWLGVGIQTFTKEIAESLGIEDVTEGVQINDVLDDGPAEKAGFRVGDVILKWGDRDVANQRDLRIVVGRTVVGEPVKVEILRDGKRTTLDVVTGERPASETAENNDNDSDNDNDREDRFGERALVEGMELSAINDDLRRRFRIAEEVEGVVVLRVARRSTARRIGLRPGAVISRVNQREVNSPSDVADIIDDIREEGRNSVLLLINYRGVAQHVPLRLEEEDED